MTKDWFDKHVVVMTFDNDKVKEKTIHTALKKAVVKKFTKSKKTDAAERKTAPVKQ